MKHALVPAAATLVGLTGALAVAPSAHAEAVPERHRFVAQGITITWGEAPNMNDLQITRTPGAPETATSPADAKIGAAVLAAYEDVQRRAGEAQPHVTDYCTYSPDRYGKADFKPACAAHDACYSSSSTTPRLTCDERFKDALNKACNTSFTAWWETVDRKACNGVAWTYYQAVRKLGKSHYHGKGSNA